MNIRSVSWSCIECGSLLLGCPALFAGEVALPQLIDALKSPDAAARARAADQVGALGSDAADAVAPLAGLLKDDSAKVRAHAAWALGAIGAAAKPAVPALAELLRDSDAAVRRQVVQAIQAIHPGPQVMVPLCVKLMQDPDPALRVRVLQAIAGAGAKAVPGLIEALKNDHAAYWACLVLREIGPDAKDAVPALVEKLKDPRPEIRREVILTLGAMQDAALPALPQIAAMLSDEHARIAATFALGQLGRIPADAEAAIRANAKSDNRLLATVSLWALARVHPEDKELRRETGERLIAGLKDADPFVRGASARALSALPPAPEIMLPLWEKAMQNADAATAQNALDALAALGAPAVPRLIDALKHEKIRAQVAYMLGQIGPPAAPAADALAKLISDKNSRVAAEAAVAIAKIGPGAKSAVPALIAKLQQGDEAGAHALVYALGKIGPDAAAADPVLLAILKSSDGALSVAGAWALAQIHPASADIAAKTVPVLVAGLSAPLPHTRRAAVETLGGMGASAAAAIEAVRKAANDADPAVRDAAAKALKAIQG